MEFNYTKNTKKHYQDKDVASAYHSAYTTDKGLLSWRHKLIAFCEKRVVRNFIRRIEFKTALDIPAGTGKLADIFTNENAEVTSCDISSEMLAFAEMEYKNLSYTKAKFKVCDAEEIRKTLNTRFDLIVCLRLLHRVPSKVKENILTEIGNSAPIAIISFGVENSFHSIRRRIRNMIFGGGADSLCFESESVIRGLLAKNFTVREAHWVIPFFSQEKIYFVESLKIKSNID